MTVDVATVDQYAGAILGTEWESQLGASAEDLQELINSGQWRDVVNGDYFPAIVQTREIAQTLGLETTQSMLNSMTDPVELAPLDISHWGWFEEEVSGGAIPETSLPPGTSPPNPNNNPAGVLVVLAGPPAEEHHDQSFQIQFQIDDNGRHRPFQVEYAFVGGSATAGEDFIPPVDDTIEFVDGSEGIATDHKSQSVPIPIIEDLVGEPDESLHLVIVSVRPWDPPDGNIGDGSEGIPSVGNSDTAWIWNDDSRILIDEISVVEGDPSQNPSADVKLRLEWPVHHTVRFTRVNTPVGIPHEAGGSDFAWPSQAHFEFPPLQVGPITIPITILSDELVESDEVIIIHGPGYYFVNENSQSLYHEVIPGKVTILDDDTGTAPPNFIVSIDDVKVVEDDCDEGGMQAVFTVSVDRAPSVPLQLPFDVIGAFPGATEGVDFEPSGTGIVTIRPGNTRATLSIDIINDAVVEFDEEFIVRLLPRSDVTHLKDEGVATIIDDDKGEQGERCDEHDQPQPLVPCDSCTTIGLAISPYNGTAAVQSEIGETGYTVTNRSESNPHPVISVDTTLPAAPPGYTGLNRIFARLTFNGVEVGPLPLSLRPGMQPGGSMRFVMQFDASLLPTGLYQWKLELVFNFGEGEGSTVKSTFFGFEPIVNRIGSEFGNRWFLDDLDRLYFVNADDHRIITTKANDGALVSDPPADDVMLVTGTGEAIVFKAGPGGFITPDGYFDTLTGNPIHGYTLTDQSGARREFSTDGLLRKRFDRNLNQWDYYYDAARHLTAIDDPFFLRTAFAYDGNGKISSVTDYAGRQTLFTVVSGRVTQIDSPDPDGGGAKLPLTTRFEYYTLADGVEPINVGRLKKIVESNDVETTVVYDFAGRIHRLVHEDGSYQEIVSAQTIGLIDLSIDPDPEVPPADPRIAIWRDELGNERSFRFDRYGRSLESVDELGHVTTYLRDADGLATSITLPDPDGPGGRSASTFMFTYDQWGNQLASIEPVVSGPSESGLAVKTWEYVAGTSFLSMHRDENGRTTYYDRDTFGNVIRERRIVGAIDPIGAPVDDLVTTYEYSPPDVHLPGGLLKSITDALGRKTTFSYLVNPGSRRHGVLSRITYADGSAVKFEYDSTNSTRNVMAVVDENNSRTKYFYDNLDRVIRVEQPAGGGGTPHAPPIWNFDYCNCGNLKQVIDPLNRITTYDYDERNRLEQVTLPEPSVGQGHPIWRYEYSVRNEQTGVIDPLGQRTDYEYDEAGRLIRVLEADPDDGGPQERPSWELTYDHTNLLVGVEDPLNKVTNYEYDARLRQTRILLPDPTGTTGRPTWEYAYSLSNELIGVRDPQGRITRYTYDALGHLATQKDPGQTATTEFFYDKVGNLTRRRDPRGQETEYVYDLRDRVTDVLEPLVTGATVRAQTHYTYDAVGNLTSLTDPAGNVTSWGYDALHRRTSEIDALTTINVRQFTYDAVGNLTSSNNGNGQGAEFQYDALNRLVRELGKEGTTTNRIIDYGYDLAGRLTTATDPNGGYAFAYDNLSRLKATTANLNGLPSVTLGQTYDALSRLTESRATIGGTVDFVNAYQYDLADRLTRITQAGLAGGNAVAEKRVDLDWNRAGQLTDVERFKNLAGDQLIAASSLAYDSTGRLANLVHDLAAIPGTSNRTLAWQYDAAHRVTQFKHTGESSTAALFSYDERNQLVGVDRPAGTTTDEAFAFDQGGNRTAAAGQSYMVVANNQLKFDGAFTYLYDGAGNRIRRFVDGNGDGLLNHISDTQVTEYSWDHRDRLVEVRETTGFFGNQSRRITYRYDMFDRLIGRDIREGTESSIDRSERFVYDGDDVVLEFVDPDGTGPAPMALDTRYLHGPLVDQVLAQEDLTVALGDDRRVLWHLADNQQTVRDLVDQNGAIIEHYVYDAFGQLLEVEDGAGNPLANPSTQYLYTGRWLDPNTGLQYNRARWYDPPVGKWLSEDPSGFAGGDYNLTRYVSNGPVNATDPSGLEVMVSPSRYAARIHAAAIEFLFGGSVEAYDPNGNSPDIWTRPKGGLGGAVGGFAEEATLRQFDLLEKDPTCMSQLGMLEGAQHVPAIGPATRLATGRNVLGGDASRYRAGTELVLEFAPALGLRLISCGRSTKEIVRGNLNVYEALSEQSVRGVSRSSHRRQANRLLYAQLESDSRMASVFDSLLDSNVLLHMRSGKGTQLLNPPGAVWHHPGSRAGVVQLLKRQEHSDRLLQPILHPEGIGGFGTFYGNP